MGCCAGKGKEKYSLLEQRAIDLENIKEKHLLKQQLLEQRTIDFENLIEVKLFDKDMKEYQNFIKPNYIKVISIPPFTVTKIMISAGDSVPCKVWKESKWIDSKVLNSNGLIIEIANIPSAYHMFSNNEETYFRFESLDINGIITSRRELYIN